MALDGRLDEALAHLQRGARRRPGAGGLRPRRRRPRVAARPARLAGSETRARGDGRWYPAGLDAEGSPRRAEPRAAQGSRGDQGAVLIVAGAGSGKTRVLTHRIAHLVRDHGVAPFQILAITFTNRAAREMVERVDGLLGAAQPRMWVMTFHAACARILRAEAVRLGLPAGLHDLRPGRPDPGREGRAGGRARQGPEAVSAARHPRPHLRREEPARRAASSSRTRRTGSSTDRRRGVRRLPAPPHSRPARWTSTTC